MKAPITYTHDMDLSGYHVVFDRSGRDTQDDKLAIFSNDEDAEADLDYKRESYAKDLRSQISDLREAFTVAETIAEQSKIDKQINDLEEKLIDIDDDFICFPLLDHEGYGFASDELMVLEEDA